MPSSGGQRPIAFPGNISASAFVPSGPTFYNQPSTAPAGNSVPQYPVYNSPSAVYTPDDWIHTLGSPHATTGHSGVKPPRMKVPSFDGDPKGWPMFIQMFKIFVHDAVTSDAERIAHLHESLTPEIRKNIGGALLNPGLYQHALMELHKRYGNPQLVAQASTSSHLKLQPFQDNDFNSLRAFSANIHSVVATLRLGGYGMELHSHATLSQLISKLPPALKSRWGEKSWAMQPRLTTVEDLDEWLDGVAMAEQSIRAESHDHSQSNPKKNSKEKRQGSKSINVFATTAEITTEPSTAISPRCPGCNSTHKHHLKDCRQFKKIPVEKRVAIVKENKVCFRCLVLGHRSRECSQKERCDQANYDGTHHPLLHGAPRMYPKPAVETPAGFSGAIEAETIGSRTLLPIVPVSIKTNGKSVVLFALLDQGSQILVMKTATASQLGLEGPVRRVTTKTVEGKSKPVNRMIVKFDISSIDGRYSFNIVNEHVADTFNLNKRSIDLANLIKKWPYLSHVPIYSLKEENVAILIRQNHPAAIEIFENRKDPFHQRAPRAYLTAFGWCIGVPDGSFGHEENDCFLLSLAEERCDLLLQQFIENDTFGTKPNVVMPISQEEERACSIMANTTRHIGERYESGLLWKMDDPKLPNYFFAAQRRFFSLENNFAKNPVLAETYKAAIDTYVKLKHARRLSREEIDAGPAGRIWYNPHHPVSTQTNRASVGWYSIYPQNATGSA